MSEPVAELWHIHATTGDGRTFVVVSQRKLPNEVVRWFVAQERPDWPEVVTIVTRPAPAPPAPARESVPEKQVALEPPKMAEPDPELEALPPEPPMVEPPTLLRPKVDRADLVRRAKQRSRTVPWSKRLSKKEVQAGKELVDDMWYARPKTRADCADVQRPCPFVACRHNLYLEATPAGGVKLNFPGIEPHEMRESCVLDLSEQGGRTLEQVGKVMNLTRERIRQIEEHAMKKFGTMGELAHDPIGERVGTIGDVEL